MPTHAQRLAVACLTFLALAACEGTTDFRTTETVVVDTTVTSYSGDQIIDLTTTGAAWDHRSHVKSLMVTSLTATIVSVQAGNAAGVGSGTLAVRADGAPADGSQDVQVATLTNADLRPGTTFVVPDPNAATPIVLGALEGSGKFQAVARGSADAAPVRFTVDLSIAGHVRYSLP
jgi:hypothetical protein